MRAAEAAAGPDAALAPWRSRWGLAADGAAFATPSSVLQPVRLHGRAAYLTLATVAEEAAGGRVLRWWAGRGAAAVLAADGDALVLERAGGDRDLVALAASGVVGDEAATRILCRAALRLHSVDDLPRPDGLVDLRRWFRELFEHAAENPVAHDGLFARAAEEAEALLADPVGDVCCTATCITATCSISAQTRTRAAAGTGVRSIRSTSTATRPSISRTSCAIRTGRSRSRPVGSNERCG